MSDGLLVQLEPGRRLNRFSLRGAPRGDVRHPRVVRHYPKGSDEETPEGSSVPTDKDGLRDCEGVTLSSQSDLVGYRSH